MIKTKAGLRELAKQLGNIADACRLMGYSRDSFYRFKRCTTRAARPRCSKSVDGEFESDCPGYCGAHNRHPYELYLAVNGIEHTRTRIKRPQLTVRLTRGHYSFAPSSPSSLRV